MGTEVWIATTRYYKYNIFSYKFAINKGKYGEKNEKVFTPCTEDVNWTYVRCLEDQGIFYPVSGGVFSCPKF